MLRSELIKELVKQNEQFGDGESYVAISKNNGVIAENIKSIELDANNSTVINATN